MNKLFFKKIIDKFYSKEFLRYFIVGSTSVLLDVGTLYILKQVLGWSAVMAVVINQIIIWIYVFFLNKFWTFSSKGNLTKQMIRYFILAIINYIIAIVWMWTLNGILGQNYLLVRMSNIVLATIWNFILYKIFVYKADPNLSSPLY